MSSLSALADWFDHWEASFWRTQDDWLIESQRLGDASPAVVFAEWAGSRVNRLPFSVGTEVTGSVMDLLRLGSEIDTSSRWGFAKSLFKDLSRVLVVASPGVGSVIRRGVIRSRFAGLMATAGLETLSAVPGPCRYVAVNNALSYVRGKTMQMFASLDDVLAIRSTAASDANMIDEILRHPKVATLIRKAEVFWTEVPGVTSLDAAMVKAGQVEGALVIGVQWTSTAGKAMAHRLNLVKAPNGTVRILDYSEGASFTGYSSIRELAAKRAHSADWQGFERAVLRPGVLLFQSRRLKFLEVANNNWHLVVPVAMGLRWGAGPLERNVRRIAMSVWAYFKQHLGDAAPPAPDAPEPAPGPAPVNPPWTGARPPEAAQAPRSDWLTGVQYRLKYLAYYNGAIHGTNDRATKDAVFSFQSDQRIRIDGIPGPETQAELVSVCGF